VPVQARLLLLTEAILLEVLAYRDLFFDALVNEFTLISLTAFVLEEMDAHFSLVLSHIPFEVDRLLKSVNFIVALHITRIGLPVAVRRRWKHSIDIRHALHSSMVLSEGVIMALHLMRLAILSSVLESIIGRISVEVHRIVVLVVHIYLINYRLY